MKHLSLFGSALKNALMVTLILFLAAACIPTPTPTPVKTPTATQTSTATETPTATQTTTQTPTATEPPTATEQPTDAPVPTEAPAGNIQVTNCDTLLPATACIPDWQPSSDYVPLAGLPSANCTQQILDQGTGQCAVYTYTNNNGQVFTVQVEGAGPGAVDQYVSDARVYFEVQQAGAAIPDAVELPSIAEILVSTAVDVTKTSRGDLSNFRETLLKDNEKITAMDVIIAATKEDPAKLNDFNPPVGPRQGAACLPGGRGRQQQGSR